MAKRAKGCLKGIPKIHQQQRSLWLELWPKNMLNTTRGRQAENTKRNWQSSECTKTPFCYKSATSKTHCRLLCVSLCQATHRKRDDMNPHSVMLSSVRVTTDYWLATRRQRTPPVTSFMGQSCRVHVDLMTAALCSLVWDVPSLLPSEWTGEACCPATRPPLQTRHCWRWGELQPHGDRWHLWWAAHVCPRMVWQEGRYTEDLHRYLN